MLRVLLLVITGLLPCGVYAQTLTIDPTTVVYDWAARCEGGPKITRPVMQATGGSGNYTWTALTPPPANLVLNTDGTFSGEIDTAIAGAAPWTFDVEVLDTTTTNTAQATITMIYSASSPGCQDTDGNGCAARAMAPIWALVYMALAALLLRKWAAGREL